MKTYLLKQDFWFANAGTKVIYDPKWHAFIVGEQMYSLRGSVIEGEVTMLLWFMIDNKLNSIITGGEVRGGGDAGACY